MRLTRFLFCSADAGGGIRCRRWLFCVLMIFQWSFACADDYSSEDSSLWLDNLDVRFDVLMSLTEFEFEETPFSQRFPVNDFTRLPGQEQRLELRPDLKFKSDHCSTQFKLRHITSSYDNGGPLEGEVESDTFFNTAMFRCRLGSAFEMSVGRQKLLWGNGQFRSPSNPFYRESILFDPTAEVTGKDFFVASYRPDFQWEVNAIFNWDQSHVDEDPNPSAEFLKSAALKMEYTGNSSHYGVILSEREDAEPRLGLFGNYTLNRAVLLYGEFTASEDVQGLLPYRDESGDLVGFVPAQLVDDDTRHTLLLGSSYTFESGLTTYFEYLNSSEGFNSRQADEWQQIGYDAASLFGTPQMPQAAQILADAVYPIWRQTRQNYLVFQLSRTQYLNKIDFAFQYVNNLDDDGGRSAFRATYDIGDQAEIFFLFNYNSGGGDREFGRIVNNLFLFGLKVYAF